MNVMRLILGVMLVATASCAQTALLGSLKPSSTVVTNTPTLQQVVNAGATANGNVAFSTSSDEFRVGSNAGASTTGDEGIYIGSYSGLFAETLAGLHLGEYAGMSASGSRSLYLGRYAGKDAVGDDWLFIDSYASAPLGNKKGTNDNIVINGNTGEMWLGRGGGTTTIRGTVIIPGLAAVTNNQTGVTLGLASGSTVATAVSSNQPVTLAQLEERTSLLGETFYGATNVHPNEATFRTFVAAPPAPWTQAYALSVGTNAIGARLTTNTYTRIPAGMYIHTVYLQRSLAYEAGQEVTYWSTLVAVDSVTHATNILGSSSVAQVTELPASSYFSSTTVTNDYYPTNPCYLGVLRYATRVGSAITVTVHGGTTYPTHLDTPSLNLSAGIANVIVGTSTGTVSGGIATVSFGAAQIAAAGGLTNGGPVAVAATNAQTQVTNHIAQTGNAAHAGMMLTNGNAVALTNFPALVVKTNETDVTFAGWRFFTGAGGYMQSTLGQGRILDDGSQLVMKFQPVFRQLGSTNGSVVVTFSDVLRAYDSAGNNGVDVQWSITNTAQQVTNNASPYQPWTQVMGTPTNLGTTVMSFTNGSMPFLSCTGAQTVAWIDGNANGWGTAGVNRQRLALWKGSWSVTIQSNASVVHASTITLSSTKTNHIVANITVGSGYTNVVLYPLTAQ